MQHNQSGQKEQQWITATGFVFLTSVHKTLTRGTTYVKSPLQVAPHTLQRAAALREDRLKMDTLQQRGSTIRVTD